jgi:hypothetical protein
MNKSDLKQKLINKGCSVDFVDDVIEKTNREYEILVKSKSSNYWWAWKDNDKYIMHKESGGWYETGLCVKTSKKFLEDFDDVVLDDRTIGEEVSMKIDISKRPKHPIRIKVYGVTDKINKTYELLKQLGYSEYTELSLSAWIISNAYYLNINHSDDEYMKISWDHEDVIKEYSVMEYEDLLELVSAKDYVEESPHNIKLEWFDKFLQGVKVQYRIGDAVGSETSQWHNLTWKSLKDLQHPSIEFREAPKYVVLNGITFKDKESLLKHIANNYDLG